MSIMTMKARRTVAAGVATAFGAAALSVLAVAPAQAANTPAPGALQWGVSQQYVDHLATRTFTGGAALTGSAFTFPQTSASVTAGVTTLTYGGSVKGGFVNAGTEYYSVTFADPTVVVQADGDAVVSAVVSSQNAAMGPTAADSRTAARVTVLEVPATGTLTSGFTAAASPAGDFAASLFDQLVPGVQPHFKQTGATEQTKKRPADFTATSAPAVTVTEAVSGSNATLDIKGAAFVGGDANYQGVYVGVAPTGARPDVTSQSNMDAFVASDWVPAAAITNGAFARSLKVDLNKLQAGTKYSLYTWQAHRSTSRALDTETELKLAKPAAAKATSVLKAKWKTKATAAKAGKLKVTVKKSGDVVATGKVVAKIKVKGAKKAKTVKAKLNKKGVATVKVPKGAKKVKLTYAGDAAYAKAKKKVVTVKK